MKKILVNSLLLIYAIFFSLSIQRPLIREKKNISSESEKHFTAWELEIIKLIADGLTNQEIAAKVQRPESLKEVPLHRIHSVTNGLEFPVPPPHHSASIPWFEYP